MEIVRLFLAFLQVGALSFGGGYAAIPLISRQAIDHYG
ncbi:MAG: chromate transporter, partial [Lachnospiraceae bacterium]|nr:chromate transporter [Lachnospiraceae bacterium]